MRSTVTGCIDRQGSGAGPFGKGNRRIQAAVSGKIIARETLRAKRRDVIAPLYGGDYTRKRKLLEKQKKGKKELKEKGEVHIPQKVFLEMFKIK